MADFTPSRAEFCRLAGQGNLIPVYCEFLADLQTPVLATLKLDRGPQAFLLESVEGREKWATYSFLGVSPQQTFSFSGKHITRKDGRGRVIREKSDQPLGVLRDVLKTFHPVQVPGVPRFHGGAVGYLAYDCVRLFEDLPEPRRPQKDQMKWPEGHFMITGDLVVFNNLRQQIQIIANVLIPPRATARDLVHLYDATCRRLEGLRKQLQRGLAVEPRRSRPSVSAPKALLSKNQYERMVQQAKHYIHEGDIIQTVLSNRYTGRTNLAPLQIYRALRLINPSPYMFYYRFGDHALVGSSPETLVRLEDGVINVRPIAGTRPRGVGDEDDERMAAELQHDPKEIAEHVMLVDLGRNDVGRVAQGGSVRVKQLMAVERYSHVMHLVSDVQGKLRPGLDAFDVLAATFPAGTLTGAPKIRAMEIIDELERARRGPYGGALGYISFSGNMDFCITIRALHLANERYAVQAGAGIVADSRPTAEYRECENKAKAVLKALDLAKNL